MTVGMRAWARMVYDLLHAFYRGCLAANFNGKAGS